MHEILQRLEREARERVAAVENDPAGRKKMREAFYAKYGDGSSFETYGFGASELAFMQWEIDRGALDPGTGSAWWRKVNSTLLYWAELADLVAEAGIEHEVLPDEARAWVDYIEAPGAQRWYRAHNLSIVRGYLDSIPEALRETPNEQLFMNEVLYRLLYAEALVTGIAMGELGEIAADPRLPSVDILVQIPEVYPDDYPLTPQDVVNVEHLGSSLGDDLAKVLDEAIILPHVERLYHLVAGILDVPQLVRLVKDGVPVYPDRAAGLRPDASGPRKKIAILGGGSSALAAAWELTREDGWRDRYDVTVYTLGWRVGGKTATGRGPYSRIEEHGIHILQGWYDETFRLLAAIYDERREKRLDPRSPFQAWQQGFDRNDSTLITEWIPGRGWVNWPLILPPNDFVPGEGGPLPTWAIIEKVVALALELVLGSPYQSGQSPIAKWILDRFFPKDGAHEALGPILGHVRALKAPRSAGVTHGADVVLEVMEKALAHLGEGLSALRAEDDRLRRILLLVELVLVTLRGILADVWDPKTGTFEWSRIDHLDFRAWLRSHGASDTLANSAPVRFLYCGTFANLVGPSEAGGLVAAGTAMRFLVESAGYKGSFVWQFRAGTGDTMIMPIYEVLVARGVRFELFRDVKQVHPGANGVDRITIGEQVTLRSGTYEPTIRVDTAAGSVRAWPSHPLYDQIDPAEAEILREKEIDLESPWADWKCPRERDLVRGTDFDVAILAIPVGTLRTITSEIYDRDARWREMIDGVATTATMSMQLWVRPSLEELGMHLADWGLAEHRCAPNAVVYASPMYSWLDSSLVLPFERWPADRAPKVAAYFTGSMSDAARIPPFDDHAFPALQYERLRALSEQWLWDAMGFFWPKATRPEAPAGFDPALLVGETSEATPTQKLDFQFFRANVDPWQRYTLSLPGTALHRLKTDASGYANLLLAGDWIDFGMNVGYIEGALVSGIQAGEAARKALTARS